MDIGVSVVWHLLYHWWTASIKPKLLFSLCRLCFPATFQFSQNKAIKRKIIESGKSNCRTYKKTNYFTLVFVWCLTIGKVTMNYLIRYQDIFAQTLKNQAFNIASGYMCIPFIYRLLKSQIHVHIFSQVNTLNKNVNIAHLALIYSKVYS